MKETSSLPLDSAGFLRLKLLQAVQANPQYSLRAFAKKLGISPSGLSVILSRKKQLSLSRAHALAELMGLNLQEKEEFLLLVQFETSKNELVKAQAYDRLRKLTEGDSSPHFDLSLEQFQLISEWYGFAVFEMVSSFAAAWSSMQIADFLGITRAEVDVTLDRLIRLELIEVETRKDEKRFKRVEDRMIVSSARPNEALQNYYTGILNKSIESVRTQSPQEKVIGTEVIAFDPDQLGEIKKLTDQYLDSLIAIARKGKRPTEMYQVITNFFRLNPKPQRKLKEKSK